MTDFEVNDLPAYREWRAGFQSPPDALAFMAEHLSLASAFLWARLLAPDLIVERGCVILKDRYTPENFDQWWAVEPGNTVAIERALNHIHLWDVFETASEEEERALEALAVRIARSWELHAAQAFPDREFHAEVTDEYGPTIVIDSQPRIQRDQSR